MKHIIEIKCSEEELEFLKRHKFIFSSKNFDLSSDDLYRYYKFLFKIDKAEGKDFFDDIFKDGDE